MIEGKKRNLQKLRIIFLECFEGWGLILGYPTILIPGLQYKGDNSTAQPDFVLNDDEISWIGSINLLCVPIGSLTSGLLMDPIGKRRMMQVRLDFLSLILSCEASLIFQNIEL